MWEYRSKEVKVERARRESEGLEELRNRIRKQYPEAQPHVRSEAKAWEDGRLNIQEASDEKRLENELEVLRKEIIEKYPSAEDYPPKSEANPKVGKDVDGLGKKRGTKACFFWTTPARLRCRF
jgi:hypothetical protein